MLLAFDRPVYPRCQQLCLCLGGAQIH